MAFPFMVKYSQPFCPHLPLDPRQRVGDRPSNLTQRRHRLFARLAGTHDNVLDSGDESTVRFKDSLGVGELDVRMEASMEFTTGSLGTLCMVLIVSVDESSGVDISSSSTMTKMVLTS